MILLVNLLGVVDLMERGHTWVIAGKVVELVKERFSRVYTTLVTVFAWYTVEHTRAQILLVNIHVS